MSETTQKSVDDIYLERANSILMTSFRNLFLLFNLELSEKNDSEIKLINKTYIPKIDVIISKTDDNRLFTYINKLGSIELNNMIHSLIKRKSYLDSLINKNTILFNKLLYLKKRKFPSPYENKFANSPEYIDQIIIKIIKLQIKIIIYSFITDTTNPNEEIKKLKFLMDRLTTQITTTGENLDQIYIQPQAGGSLTDEVNIMVKSLKLKIKNLYIYK